MTEERLRRFQRLGGVPLAKLEPADRAVVESRVIVGVEPYRQAVFTYRCPACGRVERSDMEMGPACTGPSWTDDHPPEPMELVP